MTRPRLNDEPHLAVRALRTRQAEDVDVYSFFIAGADLLKIADISRVHRDFQGALQGFQRKQIRSHVQSIVDFLDQGPVLFPNAVILAISERAHFTQSRGEKPTGDTRIADAGTLRIPIRLDGTKEAWIVDGQQRSLALSKTKNRAFPVPVVAFVSEDLSVHREQFILVNKARPLSPRLINELLPEVQSALPRDLAPRKIPSELVNLLHVGKDSPFQNLVRRPSEENAEAIVTDTALIHMIKNSMNSPLGALAPYKATASSSARVDEMYRVLIAYWSAVAEVFAEAWGKPPTESRLMHSAGIVAMGSLMDRILLRRPPAQSDIKAHARDSLRRIADKCHWTSGRWEDLDREWNDIQSTNKDVRMLEDHLSRLDHASTFSKVA